MTKFQKALFALRNNPENSKFSDLAFVCEQLFGKPTMTGGSHRVYRTGWADNPRIVIQSRGTQAKAYQVRQVLLVVDRKQFEEEADD